MIPLIVAAGALITSGTIFIKTASDEAEETVNRTLPKIAFYAAAAGAAYVAYKVYVEKPRGKGG